MKSKEEYMRDYRSRHPEYWIYLMISIILDIIGAIVIVANAIPLIKTRSSSKKEELFIFIIIGVCCWIVGLIFTKLLQSCDRNGVTEYEKYRTELEVEHRMKYQNTPVSNFTNGPTVVYANEWRCPKCGKVNQNYVGTCGKKKKKI